MSKDQTALMTIDGLPTATIPQTWRYKANDPGYYALNSLHPTQVAGPIAPESGRGPGTGNWNDDALFRTGGPADSTYDPNQGAAVVRDVLPTGNVLDTPWSTASQGSVVGAALGSQLPAGLIGKGSSALELPGGTNAGGVNHAEPGWGLGGSISWEANSPDTGSGSGVRVDPAQWTFGDIGTTASPSGGGQWAASAPDPTNWIKIAPGAEGGDGTPVVTTMQGEPDYLEQTGRDMLPARAAPTSGGGRKRRRKRRKSRSKKGWAKRAPRGRARTRMLKKCGKKCFLGPKKSFPICAKRTCKINRKGVKAAYIRAKQWGKPRKSYKSKSKTVARRSRKRRKGSRPRHRRRVYTRVARKAKSLLRRMKR